MTEEFLRKFKTLFFLTNSFAFPFGQVQRCSKQNHFLDVSSPVDRGGLYFLMQSKNSFGHHHILNAPLRSLNIRKRRRYDKKCNNNLICLEIGKQYNCIFSLPRKNRYCNLVWVYSPPVYFVLFAWPIKVSEPWAEFSRLLWLGDFSWLTVCLFVCFFKVPKEKMDYL